MEAQQYIKLDRLLPLNRLLLLLIVDVGYSRCDECSMQVVLLSVLLSSRLLPNVQNGHGHGRRRLVDRGLMKMVNLDFEIFGQPPASFGRKSPLSSRFHQSTCDIAVTFM
jgi:hypothetical protein